MNKNYKNRVEYYKQRWRQKKASGQIWAKEKLGKQYEGRNIEKMQSFADYCDNDGTTEFAEFKKEIMTILEQGIHSVLSIDWLNKKTEDLILGYYAKSKSTYRAEKAWERLSPTIKSQLEKERKTREKWLEEQIVKEQEEERKKLAKEMREERAWRKKEGLLDIDSEEEDW